MLYPTISELTKDEYNRYELALATAKCARIITNEYVKQREAAEKAATGNKEADRNLINMINKEYRDEKAVKNAVKELNEGEFKLYFPEDDGYADSIVDVSEIKPVEELPEETEDATEVIDDGDEDFDSEELADLMGADEVFDNENGFLIEDGEE